MPTTDTTTNNDFPYPTDANDGSDFATGIEELADAVDNMWSSGALVDRPTMGLVVNQKYYATDIPAEYLYDGSAWQPILACAVTQPSRSLGTVYQPNVSRPTLVAAVAVIGSGTELCEALIGATDSPSTIVGRLYLSSSLAAGTLTFLVPPGWYYEIPVFTSGALSIVAEWTL